MEQLCDKITTSLLTAKLLACNSGNHLETFEDQLQFGPLETFVIIVMSFDQSQNQMLQHIYVTPASIKTWVHRLK